MKENVKFYRCPICGNVIEIVNGDVSHVRCCGRSLELLEANTFDAAVEKHVPVINVVDGKVNVVVGEVEHPMEEKHYIMWIVQVTDNDISRVQLQPGCTPKAIFKYVSGAEIYAYCNLHGLWKAIVE